MESNVNERDTAPQKAADAVFVPTQEHGFNNKVQGYDWSQGLDYGKLIGSYITTGFQATTFGLAVNEVNRMLAKRIEPIPESLGLDEFEEDLFIKRKSNCTIFLGYTSNMCSSGIRDTIKFLVQNKLVDCIVTTAGGVEEDFIKCLAPTFVGNFELKGSTLRESGINRIGNLVIPNDNYCKFEDWAMPLLDEMVAEQKEKGTKWTPSKIIEKLGRAINNPESVYYWAAVNNIPVFSPALTDGSLGDMMYFHSYKNPGLVVDILEDLKRLNTMAVKASNSGMVILGGGLIKHHICNANLMRNGADFAVFINTACDFDGSDSGAKPDEAVSWGKIKKDATPVKVCADASLVFPILVAETFAKHHFSSASK
uniref:deoxyhypusine synthase n=1 Tax=Daphnia sinensis TaxID=1820382 RepID=A0A4Y7N889_9CRUS|nr:EOG090X07TT [Daphnia sinensis]SVE89318.1 EOG090X07TT [Daphnia sinensis]SVE89939.1 EOG090X07TT [Daphnia sinensis]SVE90567.1 EOG090X07TT [Daphnia sinensis]SVE91195.1 EOG090X07TT [Daphnia sinensis]